MLDRRSAEGVSGLPADSGSESAGAAVVAHPRLGDRHFRSEWRGAA